MARLINLHQTNAERRAKYKRIRDAGVSWSHARKMRDWTISHIELFIKSMGCKK